MLVLASCEPGLEEKAIQEFRHNVALTTFQYILPERLSLHPTRFESWLLNKLKNHENVALFTFSETILQCVRLFVCREILKAEEVVLEFYTGENLDKVTPQMCEGGGIDLWPDGFFDYSEGVLMALLNH